MAYILQGTFDLLSYWNTLGRPCSIVAMATAIKQNQINFMSGGKDRISFNCQYGEVEAQNLAVALGVAVADVTTNGGQIQI